MYEIHKKLFNDKLIGHIGRLIYHTKTRWFEPGQQGNGYDKAALADAGDDMVMLPHIPLWTNSWKFSCAVRLCQEKLQEHGKLLGWDCFLIRYKERGYIDKHRDPNPTGDHYRCNVLLTKPDPASKFTIEGQEVALAKGDAVVWRPDIHEHWLPVCTNNRFIFSVGAIIE